MTKKSTLARQHDVSEYVTELKVNHLLAEIEKRRKLLKPKSFINKKISKEQ